MPLCVGAILLPLDALRAMLDSYISLEEFNLFFDYAFSLNWETLGELHILLLVIGAVSISLFALTIFGMLRREALLVTQDCFSIF